MADLWERVKKTVSEIYTTASEKAVDGVNIGVKKLDEVSIRRELSKEFAGLGGRTYQLLKREEADALATDPTVKHHMDRLEELENRLEEKEREIRDILKPGEAPSEPGAADDDQDTQELPASSGHSGSAPSPDDPADAPGAPRH